MLIVNGTRYACETPPFSDSAQVVSEQAQSLTPSFLDSLIAYAGLNPCQL